MESIVGILDVLWELNSRELPVVHRDYYHIGSAANSTAEMVLGIEIARHPAAASIEHNDRAGLGRRSMLWGLINANCDVLRDLLVIYFTEC